MVCMIRFKNLNVKEDKACSNVPMHTRECWRWVIGRWGIGWNSTGMRNQIPNTKGIRYLNISIGEICNEIIQDTGNIKTKVSYHTARYLKLKAKVMESLIFWYVEFKCMLLSFSHIDAYSDKSSPKLLFTLDCVFEI